MSLVEEYQKQFTWRDWEKVLSICPIKNSDQILDLGCGVGDMAFELSKKGATVTGIDSNAQFIKKAQQINNGNENIFIYQDINSLELKENNYDALFCSFVPAYFPNLDTLLAKWTKMLKSNSWICLIDIDDLFNHDPLSLETHKKIDQFYKKLEGRYDFIVGRKLKPLLEKNGFSTTEYILDDQELSFQGPARPEIIDAWKNRLNRMAGLKTHFGEDYPQFEKEFLDCLSKDSHRTNCRVHCVIGKN